MTDTNQSEITPEEVYAEWHSAFNASAGRHVRRCMNFDKPRMTSDWEFYRNAATFYTRLRGRLDWKILVKAVASHKGGWFHPKGLYGIKAVGIYKAYLAKLKTSTPEELQESEIIGRIKRSLSFVCSYMMERGISDLPGYLAENMDNYPTMILHYEEGDVDFHFLASIPYLKELLLSYPEDVVADAFPNLEERYLSARTDIIFRPALKKISENIEKLVFGCMKKLKENAETPLNL